MIAPKHLHMFRISDFVCKKKSNDFDIIRISVDIISLKQIFFVRGRPNLIKKSEQIL